MFSILDSVVSSSDPTGGSFTSVGSFMGIALNVVMGTSITVALIAIIISGIQFIMSQGDPKAIDTARKYLTVSIVAMILAIGGFAVKHIVLNILGSTEGNLTNVTPNP